MNKLWAPVWFFCRQTRVGTEGNTFRVETGVCTAIKNSVWIDAAKKKKKKIEAFVPKVRRHNFEGHLSSVFKHRMLRTRSRLLFESLQLKMLSLPCTHELKD